MHPADSSGLVLVFPEDFAFQLSPDEWAALRSQFATLKAGRGHHRKYLPVAFTEHGALMAANILNSPRAVAMSIYVIRAFVQFRQSLATHADLARKLAAVEKKYDAQFKVVFDAIRKLMAPPARPKREIGFHTVKKNSLAPCPAFAARSLLYHNRGQS